MVGLKPSELKEMYLWEFNQYVKAYQQKIKEKEKNIIKIAYYTAYFNNSKKTKSLNYYIKEIDKLSTVTKRRDNNKLRYAREMFNKINKTLT